MLERILAGGGALLVALVVPAVAQAVPTLDPLKPCYVTTMTDDGPQREGFNVRAQGFTPNSTVNLAIDGQLVPGGENLQTDPTGSLGVITPLTPVPAPFIAEGSRKFTVTLTEEGNPANVVTATARTTALNVAVKPRTAKPSDRVRFKGLGFTGPGPVFAHYLYRSKLRRTVRLARRTGRCGSFRVRRRQIPVDNARIGEWTVQFDQSRAYVADPTQLDSVRLRILVSLEPS